MITNIDRSLCAGLTHQKSPIAKAAYFWCEYTGDLDAEMPRQKREVIFGRGELTRAILDELRGATGPLTSREIAQSIVALGGQDARDRKYVSELTKRVSKALRVLRDEEIVRSGTDRKGNVMWSIRALPRP